jgi:hypothetical protein
MKYDKGNRCLKCPASAVAVRRGDMVIARTKTIVVESERPTPSTRSKTRGAGERVAGPSTRTLAGQVRLHQNRRHVLYKKMVP